MEGREPVSRIPKRDMASGHVRGRGQESNTPHAIVWGTKSTLLLFLEAYLT